jgi:hypothetical protein
VKAGALLAAAIVAVGTTQQAADAVHAAPTVEGPQPAAAVRLAPAARATTAPRAQAAGGSAGRIPATKQRRAQIAAAVARESTTQSEPAAGATVPDAAAPPAVALPLPPVELPAVEPPPTPPVPVELPQVVVPAVPVPPVVPDVPVAVELP